MFAGHTDVVPTGPVETVDAPALRGRRSPMASCLAAARPDMKGGIACFAAAALDWLAEEEAAGDAGSFSHHRRRGGPAVQRHGEAPRLGGERGHRFDASLVGEPTNPARIGEAIKVGRRGSISGTITVTGSRRHVAHPLSRTIRCRASSGFSGALIGERFGEGSERFQRSKPRGGQHRRRQPRLQRHPRRGGARDLQHPLHRAGGATRRLPARIGAILDGGASGRLCAPVRALQRPAFLHRRRLLWSIRSQQP